MTLPALLVVAAFAAGIFWLGALPAEPAQWIPLALTSLLAAFGLLLRRMHALALALGLVTWLFLGALAASLERAAVPQNHLTTLVDSGRLQTADPLRWRGRLRSDPLRLPWGIRYEIELEEVEVAGAPRAVRGGLRLSYFPAPAGRPETLSELRAGDRVEALVRARPPRNFKNPSAFDFRGHLARQGIHVTGSLRSAELLRKLGDVPPSLGHRMARIRGRLLDRVDEMFPAAPRQAAVLRAMLLGDSSFVDHELAETFQKTAVYHVLVISGMHVAALAAFVYWVGRRLRVSPLRITLLILLVLAAFVAVVEDRPPIERAALMAVVVLAAGLLFRRVELLNTVSVAALLILLARPSGLVDPSFQLSFLAAAMIGALGQPWVSRSSAPYRRALEHLGDLTGDAGHPPRAVQLRLDLRAASAWLAARLPTRLAPQATLLVKAPAGAALRLWDVFLVSAAVQLGMLPLMAYYFHRVSLSGLLANIPAAFLSALMVPVGYLTLAAASVSSSLGSALAGMLGGLTEALVVPTEWLAAWAWASYRIPEPPEWLLAGFFAALLLAATAARRVQKTKWQIVFCTPLVVLALGVATFPFSPRLEPEHLEMTLLDVGQGDSIFVAFPGGRTMLVDGGGAFGATRAGGVRSGLDVGEQVVSPYLWQRGIEQLDAVVLTHAHHDHLDGLNAVLENFQVRELWVGREVSTPAYRALIASAARRGVRVVPRRRGQHFEWGGVTGTFLWPKTVTLTDRGSNNDSLVLRLDHGRVALLLPGDIEQEVEEELVARGDPLDVDFLKVAHHGSRTSTTAGFVASATPRVAAVSAGEFNPFGHPHAEVWRRLSGPGQRLLRTDRDGAATILSDGRALRVSVFAAE